MAIEHQRMDYSSHWKQTYEDCIDLKSQWEQKGKSGNLRYLVRQAQRSMAKFSDKLSEDTLSLAKNLVKLDEDSTLFEDVYHLATSILFFESQNRRVPGERISEVYRGETNSEWAPIPSIFRGREGQTASDTELQERIERLSSFVSTLEGKYPNYSEDQLIAIAQHYSKESGAKTWLIDFTSDPFIALFFATHESKSQVGKLISITKSEWSAKEIKIGDQLIMGCFQIIEVPGVKRIERQKALFLDGIHPELLEQYSPSIRKFTQYEGLIFCDPSKRITKKDLLPETKDNFRDLAINWKPNLVSNNRQLKAHPIPKQSLSPDDYAHIIENIAMNTDSSFSLEIEKAAVRKAIDRLADFHHNIYIATKSARLALPDSLLISLMIATKEITYASWTSDYPDFKKIVEVYKHQYKDLGKEYYNVFKEALAKSKTQH